MKSTNEKGGCWSKRAGLVGNTVSEEMRWWMIIVLRFRSKWRESERAEVRSCEWMSEGRGAERYVGVEGERLCNAGCASVSCGGDAECIYMAHTGL